MKSKAKILLLRRLDTHYCILQLATNVQGFFWSGITYTSCVFIELATFSSSLFELNEQLVVLSSKLAACLLVYWVYLPPAARCNIFISCYQHWTYSHATCMPGWMDGRRDGWQTNCQLFETDRQNHARSLSVEILHPEMWLLNCVRIGAKCAKKSRTWS